MTGSRARDERIPIRIVGGKTQCFLPTTPAFLGPLPQDATNAPRTIREPPSRAILEVCSFDPGEYLYVEDPSDPWTYRLGERKE